MYFDKSLHPKSYQQMRLVASWLRSPFCSLFLWLEHIWLEHILLYSCAHPSACIRYTSRWSHRQKRPLWRQTHSRPCSLAAGRWCALQPRGACVCCAGAHLPRVFAFLPRRGSGRLPLAEVEGKLRREYPHRRGLPAAGRPCSAERQQGALQGASAAAEEKRSYTLETILLGPQLYIRSHKSACRTPAATESMCDRTAASWGPPVSSRTRLAWRRLCPGCCWSSQARTSCTFFLATASCSAASGQCFWLHSSQPPPSGSDAAAAAAAAFRQSPNTSSLRPAFRRESGARQHRVRNVSGSVSAVNGSTCRHRHAPRLTLPRLVWLRPREPGWVDGTPWRKREWPEVERRQPLLALLQDRNTCVSARAHGGCAIAVRLQGLCSQLGARTQPYPHVSCGTQPALLVCSLRLLRGQGHGGRWAPGLPLLALISSLTGSN